ncbi:MAG: endonuclease/exonuclease/phosphatase family protein [Deltaproteobacteria bacterium]|nr:endonuclease/exonuclease/phosphatase family protein [Deltaproteobacteria bacterium]
MRRVSLALGLLALGALLPVQLVHRRGPAAAALRHDTYRLRILTWNVGKIFLPFDSRAADSRASDDDLAHIAHVVHETAPDVVALQELRGREQLDRLLDLVGAGWVGSVPEQEVHDRRVAIIARAPARDGGSPAGLGPGGGLTFRSVVTSTGRSAAAVSLPVAGGARALVVSIHLDAFDRDRRRVQAEEIVDWANRQPEPEVFLCGDFNFDYDFLQGQAAEHPDLNLYRFMSRTFEDLGRAAGLTTILARRVDYIFARTSGVQAREVRVIPGKRRSLMDHEPVVGSFEIRRPTASPRR